MVSLQRSLHFFFDNGSASFIANRKMDNNAHHTGELEDYKDGANILLQ